MGGDGLKTKKPWQLFAISAAGSCTAETATIPLDVLKTRLQLSGQAGSAKQYNGIVDAIGKIIRNEGFQAFSKGLKPALLRQATYGSVRIGLYEPIKVAVAKGSTELTFSQKLFSGCASGFIAAGIFNPMDLLKVRMQADVAGTRYPYLWPALVQIAKEAGVAGLYRGVLPTSCRAAVVAGAELATYDEAKQKIVQHTSLGDTIYTHFAAALLSGLAATVAGNPIDVIKSRIMNPGESQYSSVADCVVQTWRSEGVAGFYKGFLPSYTRLGPHVIIMFLVIERLRKATGWG